MATLSSSSRDRLHKSVFGLPAQRKYPMPDRAHAANAKARATQQYRRGNLTPAQYRAIFGKANWVLSRKK